MNNYSDLVTSAAQLPHSVSGSERGGGNSNQWRGASRNETVDTFPFDAFHWAAVSFVIAMTGAVLGYAAGTPGLAAVANVFCGVFAIIAGALALAGFLVPDVDSSGDLELCDAAVGARNSRAD